MSASPDPNLTSAKLDTRTVTSLVGQVAGQAVSSVDGYVAPFNHIRDLSLARTDQGVDFAGHGRIDAIGDCVITDIHNVANNSAGGGGPFLIYKLMAGDHSGSFVFIAEQHNPTHGIGAKVKKGEQISTMNGHIEIGFAAGPKGPWNPIDPYNGRADGTATEGGKRFARFLRSLGQTTQQDPGPGSGASTTVDTSSGSGSSTSIGSDDPAATARAAALSTFIQLPGIFEQFESRALAGQKSLMNDLPLLPFIEQLCQASLRNFQSMPNGNFFAFFPTTSVASIIALRTGRSTTSRFSMGQSTSPMMHLRRMST
jgi:hypothetical protein